MDEYKSSNDIRSNQTRTEMTEMSLGIITVNSFIRDYHVYVTEWEPTYGDVYRLMREPNNIKDSNAVAIVREKSGQEETLQIVDAHPNNLTGKFRSYWSCPKTYGHMVKQVSQEAYELRKSHNQGENELTEVVALVSRFLVSINLKVTIFRVVGCNRSW